MVMDSNKDQEVMIRESVPVSAHSWNQDRTKVAVSLNDSDVRILSPRGNGGGHRQEAVLTGHDMRVTSVDWAPKSGLIVTCGEDRNAYVWHPPSGGSGSSSEWKPSLVVLRINRAATFVKWSPHENKFAVASGANCISVCHFEKDNDWWLSKHVKKNIRSTVTSLDWHPDNMLLAAGTARFAVHVFAAQVKEAGDKVPANSPWYKKSPLFGDGLACVRQLKMGWVHDVAFNLDGTMLAWVSHSSTVSVMNALNNQEVCHYKMTELPMLSCLWIAPDTIMAAGHGCTPFWFKVDAGSGQIKSHGRVEEKEKKEGGGVAQASTMSAMRMFQHAERYGKQMNDTVSSQQEPGTVHVKQINALRMYSDDTVSSGSDDGKIVLWKNHGLQAKMQKLSI